MPENELKPPVRIATRRVPSDGSILDEWSKQVLSKDLTVSNFDDTNEPHRVLIECKCGDLIEVVIDL